jgi:sugar/nucleoside kinase (ribokinase family)
MTDIVEGSTEEFVAVGGPCGNMLAILACLGWRSFPAIRMGHDWASSVIRKDFAALGVDDTFLSKERAIQTQGLRVLAVASSERAALYNLETCAETHCQRPSIQCQLSVYLPAPAEPSDLT